MAPLIVNVTGTSSIARRAERAVINIYVASSGSDQAEVNSNVTGTAKELQDDLKLLSVVSLDNAVSGPPITHWSMSSLSTGSYFVWLQDAQDGPKKVRTYSASTNFEIKFADFTILGKVCTDLANMEHVSIRSIDWRLTDKTRASLAGESRKLAVNDAISKANDFAAAVDKKKVTAIEINSEGDGAIPHPAMFGAPPMRSRAALGARHEEGESLNFEPADVNLNCTVRIKFEAE